MTMAGRTPGTLGLGGAYDELQDGTLQRQATPTPGALGATAFQCVAASVVLCEKGQTVFTPSWKSNDGDTTSEDPKAYDVLSADAKKRIDKLKGKNDEELKAILRKFVANSLSTGDMGAAMVDRFYLGKQEAMRHKHGSPLAEKARHSSSFRSHVALVRDKLATLLPKAAGPGLNCQFLHNKIDVPTVNFGATLGALVAFAAFQASDELTLKALIGGTQGLRITLKNLTFTKRLLPVFDTFTADLRYEIFDLFGAGSNDIYTGAKAVEDYRDALVAFWILQHLKKGHKPYVNWIEIETQAIGGRF
jgi:hypothetical protein